LTAPLPAATMRNMSQPQPPNQPPQNPFGPQPPPNPFGEQPPYGHAPSGQPPPGYGDPYGPGGMASQQMRPTDMADDPAMRWVLPVGQSVWAIASGYLGLLSLALCFLGPFAVITGVVAIAELRRNPRLSGWGRAIIGIALGALGSLGLGMMILVLIAGGGQ
jgi:hypothetical protein